MNPDDRRLIETIADGFHPEPMDLVRQAAFRREIEERLDDREYFPVKASALLAAAAVAGVVVWLTTAPVMESPRTEVTRTEEREPAEREPSPIDVLADANAYYGEESVPPEDYLPQDYLALASYLDVTP